MSGLSSTSSSSSAAQSVPGNNVPPISFPGIASGIDYNAIITQLTNITAEQETPYKNSITQLDNQSVEVAKIQGLTVALQGTLDTLSDPKTFNAYSAVSTNTDALTATQVPGAAVTPGTYNVTSTKLGTSTEANSGAGAGQKMSATVAGVASNTIPLADSYAAITPTNGTSANGKITVNGVTVNYDVFSESLNSIIANIQTAVRAGTGDASFTASFNAGTDKVKFSSTTKPITLGATGDSGNLLQVLKLDVAAITNTASSGTVTSAYGIGGINQFEVFNGKNPQNNTVNAGYTTAVTSGTFTINGVQFTVNTANDALSDVLSRINSSAAGVTATFDQESGLLTIANKTPGAQSIVLGAGVDTSNFLAANKVTTASGGTTIVGKQSRIIFTDPAGTSHTVYGNSNTLTTAIPGLSLTMLQNTATAFAINVSQTSTTAEKAIGTFTTAYNNLMTEINTATKAPVVNSGSSTSDGTAQDAGGILYNNSQVNELKNRLTTLVSALQPTGSSSYNSLASIGLKLDNQISVSSTNITTGSGASATTTKASTQILDGTDGVLQNLDTTNFEAAFAANPNAVSAIFTQPNLFVDQLGSYLANAVGTSTQLTGRIVGTVPQTSLLQSVNNEFSTQVATDQKQIALIVDEINQQADSLRAEYSASEGIIAQLQAEQKQLGGLAGSSSSSGG